MIRDPAFYVALTVGPLALFASLVQSPVSDILWWIGIILVIISLTWGESDSYDRH